MRQSVVTTVWLGLVLTAVGFALPSVAVGQVGDAAWTLPQTSEWHPDLQGVWANNNATPLERPEERAAASQ